MVDPDHVRLMSHPVFCWRFVEPIVHGPASLNAQIAFGADFSFNLVG